VRGNPLFNNFPDQLLEDHCLCSPIASHAVERVAMSITTKFEAFRQMIDFARSAVGF
jgi:hypothetical protein